MPMLPIHQPWQSPPTRARAPQPCARRRPAAARRGAPNRAGARCPASDDLARWVSSPSCVFLVAQKGAGLFVEFFARAPETRGDSAARDAEQRRDFRQRELVELEEREHRAQIERPSVENVVETLASAPEVDQIVRHGGGIFERFIRRVRLAAAPLRTAAVRGDAERRLIEERTLGARVNARELSRSDEEHFLDAV